MATASTRAHVGTLLSQRWRLLRKLGEGGMGEVYAAEASASGIAPVAIKILRTEFVSDPPVRARFADEGRTCMRLIHPNIVRVIECATMDDETPYIVMELLEGVPLSAYTQNGGRVPMAQAVPILQGILAGLAAAHAQGVIHRDLKPDNVFLARHASGAFVVKVLDFGIAKVMDAAGGMTSRTKTGMLLGTTAYMSPEQARNASSVDQRADLWSAGVMLYEMLTGRVAFPAPTEYARLASVLTTEPEPIEHVDPSLGALSICVTRALKKNRDDRFASALEMARALSAALPIDASRGDGAFGGLAPSGALPLSRLPDVPSVFAPSASPPPLPLGLSALANTAPAPLPAAGGRPKPGGTLASAIDPQVTLDSAPPVGIAAPLMGGTLPSKDLPMLVDRATQTTRKRPIAIVVTLVASALLAGFFLGWLFARLT